MDFFVDVVGISRSAFMRKHWGTAPVASSLSDAQLQALVDAFCEGDVQRLLLECRKSCNGSYSAEEREEMERSLDAHGRTLNLPYCFCDGARALHTAAVLAFGEYSNDIEVGVYASNQGGDVAEWHCDANHNFTIQLTGTKDWHVICGGDRRAEGSRGMFDTPRNRAEQLQKTPGTAGARCFNLSPGTVLYVPPGDCARLLPLYPHVPPPACRSPCHFLCAWPSALANRTCRAILARPTGHRVVPIAGGALSVDVRIGHLTAAKWLSEASYALLSTALVQGIPRSIAGLAQYGGGSIGPLDDPAAALPLQSLQSHLRRCCVPRALPYEEALSDGLYRAASVGFLEARGCLAPRTALDAANLWVGVSSMVAITLKHRGDGRLLASLLAVSSLTGLEYCRFGVLCEAELNAALARLVESGAERVDKLSSLCSKPARLLVMLRCLLYANVLFVEAADEELGRLNEEAGGAVDEQSSSRSSSKKRQRASSSSRVAA